MCGRYSNKHSPQKLIVRYQASNKNFTYSPNTNICPTQFAPVVLMEEGKRVLRNMKWGLIPSWAKDAKIGTKCFNARAETVDEKPAFRSSFKSRRCLVPADAFYEWGIVAPEREVVEVVDHGFGREKEKVKKPAQRGPIRMSVQGEEIFSMAGLWSLWKPAEGEAIESFTIITTEANSAIKPIHDRMPVILMPGQEQAWMDQGFNNPVLIKSMLRSFPAEKIGITAPIFP